MEFEKLGAFYLGKEYDLKTGRLLDRLLIYDARDLTTHAVCVGMTGSGKTGLCIDLLEEAAIDHVPAIIVDPKGDITNILLTFPELKPEDFRPWINIDDARRKGLSEDEFAAQQAELWRNGLAQWGQSGERIRLLKDSADFVIYTPGSDAGVPVSILQSFAAPDLSWESESELLRERIQGTVRALLGLIGVEADPVRSREHILLANLFEYFWRNREDLDLLRLIQSIQHPPIRQLGAFDVDTFYPKKERFELALKLNNIIAAPSFQNWLVGQPLDIPGFMSSPEGKTRHSIFYLAHLSDPERMFFLTILLNQIITWMRTQPGTTSLRAIFYMDEIFGFFPPVANPPSKQPMLTLLKQARAFGLGIVLTTQNPADLDYKGLANAGTWFIGRLQTERDKMRLLDGLEGVSSTVGQPLNRDELSRIISSLTNRVFLLHNIHEEAPVTFQTRWAMSYLRGPLTRLQVKDLMRDRQPDQQTVSSLTVAAYSRTMPTSAMYGLDTRMELATSPPSITPQIQSLYIPARIKPTAIIGDIERREGLPVQLEGQSLIYFPTVLAMGRIHFEDRKLNLSEVKDFSLISQVKKESSRIRWEEAQTIEIDQRELMSNPEPEAKFEQVPEWINDKRRFDALKDELTDYLYRESSLRLLYSPILKLYSRPHEDEREFQLRLNQLAREQRDMEVDRLTKRYEARLGTLRERLRRAESIIAEKKADAEARKREVLVSVGESVLGVFLGRRSTRAASTALSKYRQSTSAKMRYEMAEENAKTLRQEIEELEQELKEEASKISARWDETIKTLQEVRIRPKRSNIGVSLMALAWMPHWQITYRSGKDSRKVEIAKAY
ncbi:MAG: hypothetical protein QXN62_01425 [Candidatus Bathyarchaeia archaeon]